MIPNRRKRDGFMPWVQLVLDAVIISCLLRLVFWFRFQGPYFPDQIPFSDHPFYFRLFNFMTLVLLFFLRQYGLYRPPRTTTFGLESSRIWKAAFSSVVILTAGTFFIRSFSYSRTYILISVPILGVGLCLGRYLLGLVVMWVDRGRGSQRNVLILGCNEHSRKLVAFYQKNKRLSAKAVGFLDDTLPRGQQVDGVPVLGKIDTISSYFRTNLDIHEVVLAVPGVPYETVLKLIHDCEKDLVAFRWIADIFGLITSKMSVAYYGGVPVLSFTDSPLVDWENRFIKRVLDTVCSFLLLIFLSPLFLLLAILIRFDSKGSIFYGQERIGEDGRRFRLIKFRTMKTDAEAATGPVWAVKDDPRRTRLGRFLRENNLDELPQIWNVLVGDMSLVGPRPERPFFVSQFKEDIPRYMARHAIRSGITGWAQVNGLRGNTSIEERTKYDLYYIENWSVWLDIKILFLTFFSRKNAY